jgi:hypothetical protein
MESQTFNSTALNEIYNSVFDEMNEEFLEERYDEDFDYEAWLDDQILWKTNSDDIDYNYYLNFTRHLSTAEVMELLGEINDEWVGSTGENITMKFDTNWVAQYAVWAVGNRIRRNNDNPTDNEFTRMNPAEAATAFFDYNDDPPCEESPCSCCILVEGSRERLLVKQ